MKINQFIEHLRINKNVEKSEGMENYMRNQFEFLGLQAVERRKLSSVFQKELRKETASRYDSENPEQSIIDWDVIHTLWDQPEREFQLTAIDYLKRVEKYLVLDDFKELEKLVLKKSWWDTVDFLAKNIGSLVLKYPELIQVMRSWSLHENLWIRRVSILHQLSFKEKTDTSLLSEIILDHSDEEEFFIQKAIGWALREYAKTDEQWVVDFVRDHLDDLSTLSIREATKHMK